MSKYATLRFTFDNGSTEDLLVSKITTLKKECKKVMLHVDQLPDGTHLLIGNELLIPFDKKLRQINLIPASEE